MLVIGIAKYPDRLGLALRVNIFVLQLYYIFLWVKIFPICQIHVRIYVLIFICA